MPSSPAATGPSTPRRKTARMSTGGRPPRKPSPSAYLDLEAEESDDGDGGEVRSQYGGSFICDDEEGEDEQEEEEQGQVLCLIEIVDSSVDLQCDRDYIPWEPSPPPAPKAFPSTSESILSNKDAPEIQTTSTPGMVTRAKARKEGATTSSSTSTLSGSSTQSQKVLNPLAHDRTHSTSMKGIPSGSVTFGDVPPDTQRKLVYSKPQSAVRERQPAVEEHVQLSLPLAEYKEFREFMDSLKTPVKKKLPDVVPVPAQSDVDSGANDSSASRDKGKTPIRGGQIRSLAPPVDIIGDRGSPDTPFSKPEPKSKPAARKRQRVDSIDEPAPPPASTALPASAMAAFNAAKAQANSYSASTSAKPGPSKPPAKKTKKAPAEPLVFFEEDNVRCVTYSKCEVMKPHLQDSMLAAAYERLNLPNLRAFNFNIWSSRPGPGNQRLSLYANHIGLILEVLWGFANLLRKDHIVNLSRMTPCIFQAVNRIHDKDRTKWTLCIDGATAICVSVGTVVQSSLQNYTPVNAPSRDNAGTVPLLKFVTAIPLCQEWERATAVIGMVFQDPELYAQIYEDAVTFGTRSTNHERLNKNRSKNTGMKGIPSGSTAYSNQPYTFDKAIPYDSDVPVYDARNAQFNVAKEIDNLAAILPKYKSDDGEIPNGACVAVGYTVSTYFSAKHQKQNVSFNIQWVVVLGEKPDGPIVDADDDEGAEAGDD
ncbi:hypothetical protein R3P38DRAFT_3196041 [Favolaschia claudopus]|uniref:Uncharacterized protein n=1 Tax=Favolaschia claudopus TaxID=2862362 RepID=A0AAW0BBV7_9AGAR